MDANKIRDVDGNRLTDIEVVFLISFPAGEAGDAARAILADAVKKSHDRLCTVGGLLSSARPSPSESADQPTFTGPG